MAFVKKLRSSFSSCNLLILFFFSFLLWIFSFRGFFSGQLSLVNDALPYHTHTHFFLENILKGTFPRWDPTWRWGLSFDFFLQRLGMGNPLFSGILILRKLSWTFDSSYLAFLAVYYFIGMIGFYMLAKHIFRDSRMAFAAYLLLMFSSLSTKVFNSYILLVCVPMVWFFFFLLSFTQKQEKQSLLGLTLTLALLMTTYVPFYFVAIFLSFLICFAIVYPRDLIKIPSRYLGFFKNNKILVGLCLLVIFISLIPGFKLYQQTSSGDLVFPMRHSGSSAQNEMVVDIRHTSGGGIITPIIEEDLFANLAEFQLGRFYIPVFAFLLLLLGAVNVINKRLVLLFVWGFWLFFIGLSDATGVHRFFYNHVFFFKFFRNLSYFLWFTVLPVSLLFAVEQFRMFLAHRPKTKKDKYVLQAYVVMVHAGFAAFLSTRENVILSSYLVILLSLLFFILYLRGRGETGHFSFCFFLLILITVQPLEVYHYLQKNHNSQGNLWYQQERKYVYAIGACEGADMPMDFSAQPVLRAPGVVVESKWVSFLIHNFDPRMIAEYRQCSFIAYDRVRRIEDPESLWDQGSKSPVVYRNLERIGRALATRENVAFVPADYSGPETSGGEGKYSPRAQGIGWGSRQLQTLDFNANTIKVRTTFDSPKFLVYNDAFHKDWEAFVNGKKVKLWRANIAFKGVWVPAGENTVLFFYGPRWRYFTNFFLVGACHFIFWVLLLQTFAKVIVRKITPV